MPVIIAGKHCGGHYGIPVAGQYLRFGTGEPPVTSVDILDPELDQMRGMLEVVSDILESSGIDYWLDRGTLLGAYRNGSIVPGDDDIDLRVELSDWPRIATALERELPDSLEVFLHHHGRRINPPDLRHRHAWFRNEDGEFPIAFDHGPQAGTFFHSPTALAVVWRGKGLFHKPNVDLYSCRRNSHHCCMPKGMATPWKRDGADYYCLPARRDHDIFMPVELVRPLGALQFEERSYPVPGQTRKYLEHLLGYIGKNAVHSPVTGYWEPAGGDGTNM